jgi:hypothetical protein
MNEYSKARAAFKADVEAPAKIKVSTLPLTGKSLGLVSTSQTIIMSQWNGQLKFEDIVISNLQGLTHERGGNCVANLKINITSYEGTNGATILIFGYGEAIQTSSYEMSSLQTNNMALPNEPIDDASPELKEILRILNANNADKTLPTMAVILGGVYKKSVDVHNKALEFQAADKKLSYEAAVKSAYDKFELIKTKQ